MIAGNFSDPTNERIIYLSALGLAIVGLALLVGTIVWWRRGRQEHPVLAPLEVMGGRAWASASESDRRRRLEQVRLADRGEDGDVRAASEPVDLQALVRSEPQAFDDLREPGEAVAEPVEEVPVEEVPVEEVPVEEVPVEEDAPVQKDAPVEDAPVAEDAPVDEVPDADQPVEALASGPNEPSG